MKKLSKKDVLFMFQFLIGMVSTTVFTVFFSYNIAQFCKKRKLMRKKCFDDYKKILYKPRNISVLLYYHL